MLPGFYSFLWAFRTKESISQVNKPIMHDVGKIVSSLGSLRRRAVWTRQDLYLYLYYAIWICK